MPRISSLLMALVLAAGAAHASSTTSASVTLYGVAGSITACTQTGPTESSCTEGSQEGSTGYAAADATVTEPGVLSLYAYSVGSVIDPDSPDWLAIASASFSYMIEVTGGVGQVLVVPDGLSYSCTEVSSDVGPEYCGVEPTVLLGGSYVYLAIYGVPFSFTGSAYAYAGPSGYNEGWEGTASIYEPLSSLALVEPSGNAGAPGTIILLADAPEPGTGLTGAIGLALLAFGYRRVNLRRRHPNPHPQR